VRPEQLLATTLIATDLPRVRITMGGDSLELKPNVIVASEPTQRFKVTMTPRKTGQARLLIAISLDATAEPLQIRQYPLETSA
jgi:hypothetical protein